MTAITSPFIQQNHFPFFKQPQCTSILFYFIAVTSFSTTDAMMMMMMMMMIPHLARWRAVGFFWCSRVFTFSA
jgi:hypothetical protein